MITTTYPTALDACFEYAGRELVERWQDENTFVEAEKIATEYLLELVKYGDADSVTFQYQNTGDALLVCVTE